MLDWMSPYLFVPLVAIFYGEKLETGPRKTTATLFDKIYGSSTSG